MTHSIRFAPLLTGLLLGLALPAVAADAPAVPKAAAKPAASKTSTSKAAKATKPAAKPVSESRVEARSKASQMAAASIAAEAALTPAELAIAQQVHTGHLPCELGATVQLDADQAAPGYFHIHGKGFRYRMRPVETTTGAVRLEDTHAGAVWLQLANKSMLMDQKQGRRVADECASPAQLAVAQAIKLNPPPSLLDTPAGARR